jgi:hypothetical protein
MSLNHDKSFPAISLNVLICRKFSIRHRTCLRSGNVLPAGIMTLAWIEEDLDHEKVRKNA